MSSLWPEYDHKAWLKSLKVGDEVCIYSDQRPAERFNKGVVERITPTGAFRIRQPDHDRLDKFGPDGTQHCGGTWGWTEYLRPWTKEIDDRLARNKLERSVLFYLDRSVVDREVVGTLSDDDLKKLVMALRPLRKKGD